jgi:hypothetical protein
VIQIKIHDSRGPCRDYIGILIFCVKNYVIHVKIRDSRKTTWFIKKSLITFSLKEIAPKFGYIFYSRNWYYRHSWETRPKLRNNWLLSSLGNSQNCRHELNFLLWKLMKYHFYSGTPPLLLHQSNTLDVGFHLVSWLRFGSNFRAQFHLSPISFMMFWCCVTMILWW